MPILAVDGLVKIYGRRRVVDGISMEVEPGEIVGLLGPNGAGKTTSFKMICGLVKPDKGRTFLQGTDVTRWPMHLRSRTGGMGYLPQQSSVFGKLSAEDNLKGMMQLLGFTRKQQRLRCDELLEQFKISHIRKSKAGTLSGGERRRLEIARCLVADPKIIMLDEPFAGIDPVTVQNVQIVIKELAETGISVLITDHAAREILQVTDRTYVVCEGRILCSGTAEEIVAHDEVKRKYLGEIEMPTALNGDPDSAGVEKPAAQSTVQPAKPIISMPKPAPTARLKKSKSTATPTVLPLRTAVPSVNTSTESETKRDRPKIVFSKPRNSKKAVVPFKSTDLD